MKLASTIAVAAALLTNAPLSVNALGVGGATTYSDIVWNVTSFASGWSGCTALFVDATGDLVQSNRVSIYGTLNCGLGGYGVVGSAYFGIDGSFNMNLLVGNGAALQCVRWVGLAGSCQFYNASGFNLGPAHLTLR